MWIFGYGSLMWDNWEVEYGGKKHTRAVLHGYSRAFHKKSVQNWGSTVKPCPTLGLDDREDAQCVGIAFEFPEERQEEILVNLRSREGKSFTLELLEIELLDGRRVTAYTPVNDRTRATYIGNLGNDELAKMIRVAEGTSGRCCDYIKNLRCHLIDLGIEDEAVENLWESIVDEDSA